ncbi:hypothetical protein FQZ97_838510 [compost metagenome]
MAFGGTHVRAAAQQFGGVADGQRLGDHRQRPGRKVYRKLLRALAEEGGDAVAGAGFLGLQLRQAGLGGGQAAVGAQHIQFTADTGFTQLFGEAAGLLLVLQVVAGDAFAQLGAAQVAVGVHQLGDQADLQLLQVGFGRVGLRFAGLDLALDTTEQVQFPGHVQAQVVAFGIHALLGDARLLALADLGAGAGGDHRQLVVADVVADGAGGLEAGEGDAQLAVFLQGLLHQLVQGRVVELLPPEAFETGAVDLGGVGRGEPCGLALGGLVVRAHGAGGKRQCQQGRGKSLVDHACTSFSCGARAALRASRFSTNPRIRT